MRLSLFFRRLLIFTTMVSFTVVAFAPPAGAFFLDDVLNSLKGIVATAPTRDFSLNSTIKHAPNGDLNKNGLIEAGEVIRFSYEINNPTNIEIRFATLKTNIPRNLLNFIHNIQGSMSLSDKNKTITIPNLSINPGEHLIISFDARVNYFTDGDKLLSTEPELITSDKKSFIKSKRQEIKARKLKDKIPFEIVKKTNL